MNLRIVFLILFASSFSMGCLCCGGCGADQQKADMREAETLDVAGKTKEAVAKYKLVFGSYWTNPGEKVKIISRIALLETKSGNTEEAKYWMLRGLQEKLNIEYKEPDVQKLFATVKKEHDEALAKAAEEKRKKEAEDEKKWEEYRQGKTRTEIVSSKEKVEGRAKRRAKAEAEAASLNEANRKVYDSEVARLTAQHQEKHKKFREDQEAFEKARLDYQMNKAEIEAAKKLNAARPPEKASKGLKEIAKRKYQEIIEFYPSTQAAKDAAILLGGGDVVTRKLPLELSRPVAPTEPRLKLPPPPEPVPVAPDPEDVAAAQAKAKAEADRAEAARRAEEEYDVNGLVLLRKTVRGGYDEFHYEITGTVVNRRSRTLTYAQITFNIYDERGARVGTALANINNLEPGSQWNFKAVSLDPNGRMHKLSKLSGF